ncbi:MAG: ATP-binding protein [Hyphomicrobiaceae bacterium]
MTGFSEDLEQYRQAVWILDPVRNRVLAANALGCARFGWSTDTRMPPLILDAGMPGFVRLRFLIGEGDLKSPQQEDLLLWTRNGAERIPCLVSRVSGVDERLLLVEERSETHTFEKRSVAGKPQIQQDTPKAAKKETKTPRKPALKRRKKNATKASPTAEEKTAANKVEPVSKKSNKTAKKTKPSRSSSRSKSSTCSSSKVKSTAKRKPAPKSKSKNEIAQPELPISSPIPPVSEEDRDAAVLLAIAKQIRSGKKMNLSPAQTESLRDAPVSRRATPDKLRQSEVSSSAEASSSAKSSSTQNKAKRKPNKRNDDFLSVPDFNKVEQALKFSVEALRQAAQYSNNEPTVDGGLGNIPISNMTVAGLAKLAHEMKTSLSAISAASEIMRDELIGPIENARYKSYASDIHDNAQHLLGVIARMLPKETEDQQESKGPTEYTELDFNDLTQRVVSGLRPLAKERGLTLAFTAKQRLPHVVADATSVRQIIINLVTNAMKFTPAGGKITVATSYRLNGPVKLSVRDTGPGMPHAAVQQALKGKGPDALRRRQGGGYGLGFPLIHQLAEQNGAKLDIKSKLGRGTTVDVCFGKDRVIPV